jgi:chemotaxis protein MotB
LVLSATFVLAYYLPLHRAHQTLTGRHRELTTKLRGIEEKLTQAQTELQAATKKRDELQAAAQQHEGASKSSGDRVDGVKSALSSKLEKAVKKGDAAVGAMRGRVFVAVSSKAIFAKDDVSAGGKSLLCDVAKASESFPLRVGVVGDAETGSKDSAWTASATRAAKAAQTLGEKCQVPAARLAATGFGKSSPNGGAFEGAKLDAERVEIEIATDTP